MSNTNRETPMRDSIATFDAKLRTADQRDARTIAELFLISSDGLAEYIWTQVGEANETPIETGTRRYARVGCDFSYENCVLACVNGRVVGMAHSFPMYVPTHAEPCEDPVLKPYSELERDNSLYISGLALHPEFRNLGIGSQLLDAISKRAGWDGLRELSLICFDNNTKAMRFYARHGFEAVAQRPLVPHPMLRYQAGNAVLLTKEVV